VAVVKNHGSKKAQDVPESVLQEAQSGVRVELSLGHLATRTTAERLMLRLSALLLLKR